VKTLIEIEVHDKTVMIRTVTIEEVADEAPRTVPLETIAAGSSHAACLGLKSWLDVQIARTGEA
jgi:hypothetical protein